MTALILSCGFLASIGENTAVVRYTRQTVGRASEAVAKLTGMGFRVVSNTQGADMSEIAMERSTGC